MGKGRHAEEQPEPPAEHEVYAQGCQIDHKPLAAEERTPTPEAHGCTLVRHEGGIKAIYCPEHAVEGRMHQQQLNKRLAPPQR
jgi:hypothetical protein